MLGGGTAAAFEIDGARIAARGDGARLVLDLSAATPFRAFALRAPDRAVVDLPMPERVAPLRLDAPGLVSRMRSGAFEKGSWRLVLELARPLAVEAAALWRPQGGHGHRLVVDLAPRTAGASAGRTFGDWKPRVEAPLPPLPRLPPGLARPMIVIDPGHGGLDPGAIGRFGTEEKTLVLDFATTLALRLAASGRYDVRLTRLEDRFVRLRERVALAAGADLFISLHADAVASGNAAGASVYTLSDKGSDELARELAARENRTDLVAGLDFDGGEAVAGDLLDMQRRSSANRSVTFAKLLTAAFAERRIPLLRRPRRSGAFRVLKSPRAPSVLIEVGFLSSPADEQRLRQVETRERLADAIEAALGRYFAGIPRFALISP